MKFLKLIGVSSALFLSAAMLQAQETNQIEVFNQKLKQLEESQARFEQLVKDQQKQIEALKQQIAATQTNAAAVPASAPAEAVTADQIKELNDKVDSVVKAQTKSLPNEFNPAIGVVGETLFSYHSQGSENTGSDRPGGFDVFQRSVELDVSASVDPFAKAYMVANASADAETGEATLGIEEAAIQTTSLPGNLELKAGRFFGEFGKLSYIHDHELPFVNRPLALDQYIGGESRTDGAQVNWLLPTPHYVSLTLGLGNGFGGDSPLNNPGTYRSLSGLNYFGRLSTYFDLTPNIELETGISGLINPTTQDRGGALFQPDSMTTFTEKERRVGGIDLRVSYVPLRNNQFQRLDWGTELLCSDSRYLVDPDGNPFTFDSYRHTVASLGGYSYLTYRWHRQWSAGFVFDYVQSPENNSDKTLAYSPYITWTVSHWNQLRLQYTHTDFNGVSGLRPDDAIYLQWAWIIGAHAHGWQQR